MMIIILSAHYHHLLNIDHPMLTGVDDDGDDNDANDKQSSVFSCQQYMYEYE